MNKTIEPTKSQTELIEDDTSKAVAFICGLGGGKTFALVIKMVKLKYRFKNCDVLYLMPTYSMFRDVLFPTMEEVLQDSGVGYKINKTTGEIFFDVGGRVILKSMDNPETIVGMNVIAVLMDEIDTIEKRKAKLVWQKALARARKAVPLLDENGEKQYDKDGDVRTHVNQMVAGTTPEGYKFMYEMFGNPETRPHNYRLIQASGRENIYLQKDYYDNLKLIYSDELVEAYIDGKFVNMAQGTVYKDYDRDKCDSDAIYREGEELHISIDFNVNNMNGIAFVKRDKVITKINNFRYQGQRGFHAVRHLKGIADTPELIEVIQNRYPKSPIYCYPDASGKNASSKGFTTSDISLLKEAGFHCRYPNKNPRIMNRVQSVNSALKTGLIRVNARLCPDLADALEQQVFNPNTDLPEKLKGSSIDDINDSFGYFIYNKFPIVRNTLKTKRLKGF